MDFVGPFRTCKGFDYLLVVIDRLTSMVHLIPTQTTVKASEVAYLYYKEVVRLPKSVVSDRDTKFTSHFWKELNRLLGTKLLMSTAFHPQTDGVTERANRTVNQILRAIVNDDQDNWVDCLPAVELAINNSINASSGFSPFELNYGRNPYMGQINETQSPFKGVSEYAEKAKWNLLCAHDHIIAARVRQSVQSNRGQKEEPNYSVGAKAYLSTKDLNLPKGRIRKLLPDNIGSYEIWEVIPEHQEKPL